MKTDRKYDPEDIESLLLHKQFYELYPEEKEFVLQFIEGPGEYESMRKTLFEVRNASNQGEWLEPDPQIKAELMKKFAAEKKSRFRIWLNSLFVLPEIKWYRQPTFRLSMAAFVVVIGLLVVFQQSENAEQQVASFEPSVDKNKNTQTDVDTSTTFESRTNGLLAQNNKQTFPEAPLTIAETMATTESEPVADMLTITQNGGPVQESERISESYKDGTSGNIFNNNEKKVIYLNEESVPKSRASAEDVKVVEEVVVSSLYSSSRKDVLKSQKSLLAATSASVSMNKQKELFNLLYTAN